LWCGVKRFENAVHRWGGTSWEPLGEGCNDDVYALASYRGGLIARGAFDVAADHVSGYWARWGPPSGDLDGDNDLDINDFVLLPECLLGPGVPLEPGCDYDDADVAGDVDLADFAELQAAFAVLPP
jgi:hypothetical protein